MAVARQPSGWWDKKTTVTRSLQNNALYAIIAVSLVVAFLVDAAVATREQFVASPYTLPILIAAAGLSPRGIRAEAERDCLLARERAVAQIASALVHEVDVSAILVVIVGQSLPLVDADSATV